VPAGEEEKIAELFGGGKTKTDIVKCQSRPRGLLSSRGRDAGHKNGSWGRLGSNAARRAYTFETFIEVGGKRPIVPNSGSFDDGASTLEENVSRSWQKRGYRRKI